MNFNMKKFILASGLLLCGLSLSAANSVPSKSAVATENEKEVKSEKKTNTTDVCTVCYNFSNGSTCSTGETCAEAETAVRITLDLE
jgi:hypothetical protein